MYQTVCHSVMPNGDSDIDKCCVNALMGKEDMRMPVFDMNSFVYGMAPQSTRKGQEVSCTETAGLVLEARRYS